MIQMNEILFQLFVIQWRSPTWSVFETDVPFRFNRYRKTLHVLNPIQRNSNKNKRRMMDDPSE